MSKLKKIIIKIKNMNKFKKLFFGFIFLLILFLTAFLSQRQNIIKPKKTLKVVTALPHVEKILNLSCKDFLKKYDIDLETKLLNGNFPETVNLVSQRNADAVISGHTPWLLINQQQEQRWNNIIPIQPFYIAKFGIYKHQNQNIDVKNINNNFKVLIPDDKSNMHFALCYLEKYDLVKLNNIENKPLNSMLSLQDLHSESNLKIDNFESVSYGQIEQKFQERISGNNNYKYTLAVNFPSFMRDENDEKINNNYQNFTNLTKIENDNFLLEDKKFNIFAITLMSRIDNQDSEEIKYLKESLQQDEIIKFYNTQLSKTQIIIDEKDKIKNIMDNIEEFFNKKD